MLECITSFILVEHLYGHDLSSRRPASGAIRAWSIRTASPFPTKDGYIGLLPYTDKQWDQFFEVAGWGETIAKDPRFSDYFTRGKHIRELYGLVERGRP